MKKTLKLMLVALLAMGMYACGEKKLTYQDMSPMASYRLHWQITLPLKT